MRAYACVKPAFRNFKEELRAAAEFAVKNQLSRVISKSGYVLQWNLTSFDVFRVEVLRKKINTPNLAGLRIIRQLHYIGRVIVTK